MKLTAQMALIFTVTLVTVVALGTATTLMRSNAAILEAVTTRFQIIEA